MLKLQAVELSKSYRGRRVVDDVELEIGQGEVVGLLGPNGAGKTTTFYIIVGLARPDSGRVLLNGDEITDLPMYLRARSGISYLPHEPSVFLLDEPFSGIDPLTVKDLQEIIRDLSRSGIGVLITDHNVRETLSVTDRAYILRSGKIFRKGSPAELSEDPEVRRVYLGDHFRLN